MRSKKDYLFVGIQLFLFVAFIIPIDFGKIELQYFGKLVALFIGLLGFGMIILAMMQLNTNLTPFPTPKADGNLVQTGLYKFMRHPIYTGIILFFFGLSLYYESIWKISVSILLVILFYFKSEYEEQILAKKYVDYEAYKKNRDGLSRSFEFIFSGKY